MRHYQTLLLALSCAGAVWSAPAPLDPHDSMAWAKNAPSSFREYKVYRVGQDFAGCRPSEKSEGMCALRVRVVELVSGAIRGKPAELKASYVVFEVHNTHKKEQTRVDEPLCDLFGERGDVHKWIGAYTPEAERIPVNKTIKGLLFPRYDFYSLRRSMRSSILLEPGERARKMVLLTGTLEGRYAHVVIHRYQVRVICPVKHRDTP
jgi:hypothetical protein